MNYRPILIKICEQYAKPGEDLGASLLVGEKEIISADDATAIAQWLELNEALWGEDSRHGRIAADIRAAIGQGGAQ